MFVGAGCAAGGVDVVVEGDYAEVFVHSYVGRVVSSGGRCDGSGVGRQTNPLV